MTATLAFTRADPPGQDASAILVRSADELRRALRAARERAVTLDLSGLNRTLRLDGERRLVELQAFTPWSAVAEATGVLGLADLSGSVGEAVSANLAAPDGTPMVSHVEAITVVTPDGEVRRADRHTHSDLFALAIGGHDLAGVLYSMTLRIDSLARALENAEAPVVLDLGEHEEVSGSTRSAEFLAAPEDLDSILAGFKRIVAERRIRLQRITVRRLRPERETFLCWATREWAQVTLEYRMRDTLGASAHAAEFERLLLDFVLPAGGSFRIGTSQHASLAQLQRCYPMLDDFIARKKRLDPAERLQTAWYRRIAQMRGL
jgi:FAD/FMN-containing dehydrogenase